MTKFIVHRCQLYRPSTSAINAIAFDEDLLKIAITRADGTLQVWDTRYYVILEKQFPPVENKAECVIWCQKRLFTVGPSGFLTEWSLHKHSPLREIKISPSAVWCIAKNSNESTLIAGTEDGAILRLNLDEDAVHPDRPISRTGRRILSLAWHEDGKTLISGSVNEIKIWNTDSNRCLCRISVIVEKPESSIKDVLVWSLAITRDFVVVSGDSRGVTSFWNGKNGTLINSFHSHKADVLCVVADENRNCVYSAGIDPSICIFMPLNEKSTRDENWGDSGAKMTPIGSNRSIVSFASDEKHCFPSYVEKLRLFYHTHDVRSMAVTANSWLLSGGVDANLTMYRYPPKTVRKLPLFNKDHVNFSADGSVVAFQYDSTIELWKLGKVQLNDSSLQDYNESGANLDLAEDPVKWAEIKATKSNWIIAMALNNTGDILAYSDRVKTTLLKINNEADTLLDQKRISIEKVPLLGGGDTDLPASFCMCFVSADCSLVLANDDDQNLTIYDTSSLFVKLRHQISYPDEKVSITRLIPSKASHSTLLAAFTSQGDVFVVDIKKKRIKIKLPKISATPIDAQFVEIESDLISDDSIGVSNKSDRCLTVLYSDGTVVEYNLDSNKFTDWTKRCLLAENAAVSFRSDKKSLQSTKKKKRDGRVDTLSALWHTVAPTGLCLNANDPNQILLYNADELILLNKTKGERDSSNFTYTSTNSFKSLCKVTFSSVGQLIVIQVNNEKFTASLPAPLKLRKFGKD